MHPVVRHHGGAVRAARLREFVFVMREDQIEAAAVNVEDVAEIRAAHGRALDGPTGTPPAPRPFPSRLVFRRLLPEPEVGGIFLVRIDGNTCASLLLVELAA